MRTTNSSLAVFLWTLRRKWKGLAVFIAATAAMIFALVHIYPEVSQLQSKAIAEAFGGDVEVSLAQESKTGGDYTLSWGKYGGADGYVVVESEAELPLSLLKGLDVPGVDLRLLATFLPNVGKISIHTFDASTTQTTITGLDRKYGEKNPLVYFGVLAFRGDVSGASIEGASQMVNTRNMASWIVLIYLAVVSISRQADVPLVDVARTMISFVPFFLAVQGFCMLASVLTNQSMKAYGISFGLYFGMGILEILGTLSQRFGLLKYVSLTYYWNYEMVFIRGDVPWGNMALLSVVAIVLFLAGMWVFERKDLVA